jgi:hypothetical protein
MLFSLVLSFHVVACVFVILAVYCNRERRGHVRNFWRRRKRRGFLRSVRDQFH